MADTDSPAGTQSGRSFGYAAVTTAFLGLLVSGYGLLLTPTSLLDGIWIAAIGFSVALAGVVGTLWAGRRLGLSAADRQTLSLSLSGLATVLLVGFLVADGFAGVGIGAVS
jgi:protein-S-isoprenylcysteine O-methyltransferase Ste14